MGEHTREISSEVMRLLFQNAMIRQIVFKELDVIVQTVFVWFLHNGTKRLR